MAYILPRTPIMSLMEYLPVKVDKSHLVTIGERLYTESIELIRELVNNAYDADATTVRVTIAQNSISVDDDGNGMDLEGLKQYFTIGSQEKLHRSKSPVYKRDRIGQFGIGKFATLSACKRFIVTTQKGVFSARVTFDKEEWSHFEENWHLPLETLEANPVRGNGTIIVLENLTKNFNVEDVARRLTEGVPLKASHFTVVLNGTRIEPKSFSGTVIPVLDGTDFGPVTGQIVILPATSASIEDLGIEIKVKQVTICRDLLGAELWGKVAARIRGEIHADFLPITSDRTGFIKDSLEYQTFQSAMRRIMEQVHAVVEKLLGKKEKRAVSRALNEALERIIKALIKNPDFSPFGPLPYGDEGGIGRAGTTPPKEDKPKEKTINLNKADVKPKKNRIKNPAAKRLTSNAVMRRLKLGQNGISCCIDHFGENAAECFSEETTVYINQDHPLYKREAKKMETHTMYIARLLTQEITMMKDPRNPRQAFERQSKLLRDAFIDS